MKNYSSILDANYDEIKKSRPWLIDINEAKTVIHDKLEDHQAKLDKANQATTNLNSSLNTLQQQIDNNKEMNPRLRQLSQTVADITDKVVKVGGMIHDRLDVVVNNTLDMSVSHSDLTENVYQVIKKFFYFYFLFMKIMNAKSILIKLSVSKKIFYLSFR